ncbi:nuclear transport factor 2 family protein [Hyphomonas sp.]|jgi:ketosteroid isomerase-like protein|uniref:nuclear transport factor 2 family protein n=1 Tax=Hyphomonas sp. TaxID=87 RepID=UPI0032D932DC
MARPDADSFAREWVAAWNDHDLDGVLSHYADGVVFHSPRIAQVMETKEDLLTGKAALREYWHAALAGANDLFFELDDVLAGSDAITLLYTNHRGQSAAETFIFDEDGEICIAIATYR